MKKKLARKKSKKAPPGNSVPLPPPIKRPAPIETGMLDTSGLERAVMRVGKLPGRR